MNIFNDPDDFKIADAMLNYLSAQPKGTITSTAALLSLVAPGYEETDVDLSGIDRALRLMAIKKGLHLITPLEYREAAIDKAYYVPFIIK